MQLASADTSLSVSPENNNVSSAPAGPMLRVVIICLCLASLLLLSSPKIAEYLIGPVVGVEVVSESGDYLIGVAFGLMAIVGALAAMGQPRNAVGWVLLLDSMFIGVASLSIAWDQFAIALDMSDRFRAIGLWLGNGGWLIGLALLISIFPFLFPNGRLPAGRVWRIGFALACTLIAGFVVFQLLALPQVLAGNVARYEELLTYVDPLIAALLPLVVVAMASLVARYRQADVHTRQQLKWLVLTVGAALIAFLVLGLLEEFGGFLFSNLIYGLLYMTIPVGLGIALLRYRLWDVDQVIRKTFQYAVVSGLLILLYLALVFVLQRLFVNMTGQDSPVVLVLSTLVIAALFNPLRHRVQLWIDRRFYRSKYNAEQVLEQFAARVRDETDIDALTAELVQVIKDTVQPEFVNVWLRPTTELTAARDETSGAN